MTGQDATDLKHAEQQLFAAQKLETLGQLTGGIAHDFNNLVGIIVGNLSLLNLYIRDPEMLERLEKCRQAADRCSKLTSQLLSFARRQPMKPRILTARQQLETMRDMLRVSVAANIEIVFVDEAPGAAISVDQIQFENALMNLILNARDSMPGGGKITITALAGLHDGASWSPGQSGHAAREAQSDVVMIEVRDTGTGMPPETLARAFEPFYSTKQEGADSGMGLAMVYGFVRQSGGHVDIVSQPGAATAVRMFLPRVGRARSAGDAPVTTMRPVQIGHDILVVEDGPDLLAVICEMLEMMGHAARGCDTASEALAQLDASPGIDVVLTDIMLRGETSGLALREQILKRTPGMRVICMSGYQDQNARRSYAAQPDIEFVGKPFDYADLAQRLAEQPSRKR